MKLSYALPLLALFAVSPALACPRPLPPTFGSATIPSKDNGATQTSSSRSFNLEESDCAPVIDRYARYGWYPSPLPGRRSSPGRTGAPWRNH